MSDCKLTFVLSPEEKKLFKDILEHYNTNNKSEAFRRLLQDFDVLIKKAEKYDTISKIVLALDVLNKYQKGELINRSRGLTNDRF
jgi:hypothetical protein